MEDPEATQLMLEALFDIRSRVLDIHGAIFGPDEENGDEEEVGSPGTELEFAL